MSESMSVDDYNRLKNELSGFGLPAKIKTKLVKKVVPQTITSAQFRHDHVDQDEHDLQSLGFDWFYLAYPRLLMYAIPNAAKRSIILASRMKDEGLTAGIPDVHLAYPHHGKPGLYIETKTVKGSVSDVQAIVHAYLRSVGYDVAVPTTFEEFQQAVIDYLKP